MYPFRDAVFEMTSNYTICRSKDERTAVDLKRTLLDCKFIIEKKSLSIMNKFL
jgi:hypothetical protein